MVTDRLWLEAGWVVTFECQGRRHTGRVVSARNQGSLERPDWYVQWVNPVTGRLGYWKQGLDGGELVKVHLPADKVVRFFDSLDAVRSTGVGYDLALPQSWFDVVYDLARENPVHFFVWAYPPGSLFGEPWGVGPPALRIAKKAGLLP